jgi:peptidylglycine monooxygenase
MSRERLTVALGATRYRVERPWGDIPVGAGLVSDVACDARGHVFVLIRRDAYLDRDGPAVAELAPDGTLLAAWGGAEIADGHMLAVAADGRVFVVDRDAHQVVVFDPGGRRLGALGGRHAPGAPFNHPSGVSIAPWGDIYVADGYGASRVHRFAADLSPIGAWGEPGQGPGRFSTPHAVWATVDGRVLVADRENDRVQVFDRAGGFLAAWTGHGRPMDVFSDTAGRIYVTDQVPRLTLLSPDGTLLGRCRPVLNGAHGLWGDAAGTLYLAELSPTRLTRLVPEPQ